jgi:hypothetical protein
MLGDMLGVKPHVCTPESHFKIDVLRRRGVDLVRDLPEIFQRIVETQRFKIWNTSVSFPVPAPQSYPQLLDHLVTEYARQHGRCERAESSSPELRGNDHPLARGFWIDHTPSNIRHAEQLFAWYPQGKMIHLVRDGRGIAASFLKLDWGPNNVEDAAHWWKENLSYGLAAESRWPDRIMRTRYEDLLADPEGQLRRICEFCRIPFDPHMLAGGTFEVPRYTAEQHQLVGQSPDVGRAEAWRRDLRVRQVEIFEAVAGELLSYLGYSRDFGLYARKMTRSERRVASMQQFYLKKFVNRARRSRRRRQIDPTQNEK